MYPNSCHALHSHKEIIFILDRIIQSWAGLAFIDGSGHLLSPKLIKNILALMQCQVQNSKYNYLSNNSNSNSPCTKKTQYEKTLLTWCGKKNYLIKKLNFSCHLTAPERKFFQNCNLCFPSQSLCSHSNCTKSLETLPSEPKTYFPTWFSSLHKYL